ncbi:M20 family metallopeptidase [Rhodomicrobium lacus]|uniref:M20 family metallopeptidase n=1 Tax=Rhodomicrobium lacus TaxID=2498452 RepID=UPI000F8DC017|nr:M20 family metallopeptidase [Rhodomicrobium lacus]
MISAIHLTQELIRFDTVNPPGNEAPCARYLGGILDAAGFSIKHPGIGENRENLIAVIGGTSEKKPICFSGHTDVVPLGAAPWTVEPFGGELAFGRVHGRGSSDMKGGVAAFVAAAVKLAPRLEGTPGLVLVITAGEERGCEGSNHMKKHGLLPPAGAIVIGEPTANRPLAGHKGVFWLEGVAKGVTAHGSMPEQGVNAVYKAARAALALEKFDFSGDAHPVLGRPTANVGWLKGGMNVNSVPDEARIGVDVRIVPGLDRKELVERFTRAAGGCVSFHVTSTADPVWTDPNDPWMADVIHVVGEVTGAEPTFGGAPYFTDAGALKPGMGNPPVVILGPGEPEQAHQTDEWCSVQRIEEAEAIYTDLIVRWCGL